MRSSPALNYNSLFKSPMILIGIGLLSGAFLAVSPGFIISLCLVVLIGLIIWYLSPKQDRSFLLKLFISAAALRIVFLTVFYFYSLSQGGSGELTPDSKLFTLKALSIAKEWRGDPGWRMGRIDDVRTLVMNGYLYLVAIFMCIIGYDPISVHSSIMSDKIINCTIGALSGVFIYLIAKKIFDQRSAKLAAIISVFFPSVFFWSLANLRESSHILITSVLIWSGMSFQETRKKRYVLYGVFSLIAMLTIRRYLFLVMSVMLTLFYFTISRLSFFKKTILLTISGIFLIMFFGMQGGLSRVYLGGEPLIDWANKNPLVELGNRNQAVLSQEGTSYIVYEPGTFEGDKVDIIKWFRSLLRGWFFFMLTPFPWQIGTKSQLFSYPQMVLWYLLLLFSVLGIFIAAKYKLKSAALLLVYLLLVTSLYALVEGNIGAAFRHRDTLLPFYFIFSAAGINYILSSTAYKIIRPDRETRC